MSRRFVVTGASGFIGRKLCEALREHGPVVAVLRDPSQEGPWDEVIVADIARDDIPSESFAGADVVFHLAGRAHAIAERTADVSLYRRVNVDGTRRVAEAAHACGARLVFASSVKAIREDDDHPTLSAYGQSKRDAEDIVLNSGIARAVVLRLSLVYGPGVEGNLGGMLRAIRSYRFPPPPPLPNRRAMVHVDDVVRAMIAAGENDGAPGKRIVIGDGVEYSTRDIYDAMNRALDRPTPTWSLPLAGWRALAAAGDVLGAIMRRRAPFDSDAYRKLFGSAWYEPGDMRSCLGVVPRLTLEDALPGMVAAR
ncbi:MAG TPA: NAD-dependent epimerase/dehydratase family protein [Candidatus Krumholzibacteria bacterium]|nr:NAD-dependent epimerase/dehydratase family protein [Candidatus Krumholzibacteria bacterium]